MGRGATSYASYADRSSFIHKPLSTRGGDEGGSPRDVLEVQSNAGFQSGPPVVFEVASRLRKNEQTNLVRFSRCWRFHLLPFFSRYARAKNTASTSFFLVLS